MRQLLDLRAPRGNATLVLWGLCLLISIALVCSQGGYFAPSWGWSAMIALAAIAFVGLAATENDGGWTDVAFVGALVAFAAWTGLSIAWSSNSASSVLELERAGVYVGAVGAFLLLAHRSVLRVVVPVLQAGITGVAAYALATRLFPLRVGAYDIPIHTTFGAVESGALLAYAGSGGMIEIALDWPRLVRTARGARISSAAPSGSAARPRTRPGRGICWRGSGSRGSPTRAPIRCPTASSAGSRSRARSRRARACSCSTSPPRA